MICKKSATANVCPKCESKLRSAIKEIPELVIASGECLQPGVGFGGGSSSGEMGIGINLVALDYWVGDELLKSLWEWESLIRESRNLSPRLPLQKAPTVENKISTAIAFHLAHLDYVISQEWINDYFEELISWRQRGLIASRQVPTKTLRIACPADIDGGGECGRLLHIGEDLKAVIYCSKCRTEWTAVRLIAVKMADRSNKWWLDIEAAASFLGISVSTVRRLANKKGVERRGMLFDLHGLLDAKGA